MKTLFLEAYGVGVALTDNRQNPEETWLKNLESDFFYFVQSAPKVSSKISIELVDEVKTAKRMLLFKTRHYEVRGWGRNRKTTFSGGSSVTCYDTTDARQFQIQAVTNEDVYEITYNLVLSALGEELDLRGLHRIHALAFNFQNKNSLVILPSGGGKSALATLLLEDRNALLFSDESPLCDQKGNLYAFPTRIGLNSIVAQALLGDRSREGRVFRRRRFPDKMLYAVQPDQVAPSGPLDFIFVGDMGSGEIANIQRVFVFITLFKTMVVGYGLAQMAEYMLRPLGLIRISRIAFQRLQTAWKLTFSEAIPFCFRVSPWAQENEGKLLRFLDQKVVASKKPDKVLKNIVESDI